MTPAPDGGWGWVIVVSAFLCNFIVDGIKYSFGITFIELMNTFGGSKSATSLIMSIHVGISCLTGPVAAAAVNRFGSKTVGALGIFISFFGFVASVFADSLLFLCVTYGFLGGLGFGMFGMAIGTILPKYFYKHLALACGLGAMGSGIGTLCFNPLSKMLVDLYSWRGLLLIEAGLILNGLACTLVLRAPPNAAFKNNSHKLLLRKNKHDTLNDTHSDVPKSPLNRIQYTDKKTEQVYEHCLLERQDVTEIDADLDEDKTKERSRKSAENSCTERVYEDTIVIRTARKSRRWISFAPLKNPPFLILLLGNCLVELSLNVPYVYLPNMMVDRGYQTQNAVWVMFVIGVFGTVSRVAVGFLADLNYVKRVNLCNFLVVVSGLLIMLCPFCFNYASFMAFAAAFGICIGGSSSLRNVLIPDLFGIDLIADCLGISLFFSGIGAFVGLPKAGALFDLTSDYTVPFIISGLEMVVSGLLFTSIPHVKKCMKK